MALITSVCAPVRTPNEILDYFNIKKDATWEEEQELIATHKVRPQSPPPNIDCPMFEWPGSPRVFPREQERLEMGGAEVEQRQGRQARESTEQSRQREERDPPSRQPACIRHATRWRRRRRQRAENLEWFEISGLEYGLARSP